MTDSAPSEVMGGSSFPSTLTASQSTSTLQEGNIASSKRTLFVAVGDGYSGYYAVEGRSFVLVARESAAHRSR